MSQEKQKPEDLTVTLDRYLMFVGCADPECLEDHTHWQGWDCLACASDDLDAIRAACLKIPDHLWWQVIDLYKMSVIMRSMYASARKH